MTRCALKKFGCKTVHPQLGHFLAEDDLRHHINVAIKKGTDTFLAARYKVLAIFGFKPGMFN